MSLKEKLLKNSTIKEASMLNDSKVYGKKDSIVTEVPIINVAFSGHFDGGLVPGLTQFAGPSKHFKTGFSLFMAKAFQDKYEDGIILFYDTEFGAPESYFQRFGIDTDRVVHIPIEDIEQLKFDIMNFV